MTMHIGPEAPVARLRTRSPLSSALVAILTVLALGSCASGPAKTVPDKQPTTDKQPVSAQQPAAERNAKVQAVASAEAMLEKGDAAGAADKLGQLAAASPSDPELKLAQAAALVSAGKLSEARKGVETVLVSDPKNLHALTMGAELARFDGDAKARRAYLDRALAVAPSDASVLSAWGDYHLDQKDWPKADDFYRRAVAADSKSVDAHLGLGRALYREEKFPESEAELTTAIGLEPASPLAYSDRSKARYRQGKLKEAESDLDEAVSRAPDESWLYIERGHFRLDRKNVKGAEEDFDRAIAIDPGYFLPYAYRGGLREETGRDEEALADYRKVIELYPDYWYAYESAGTTSFRLGLWAECAADFKQAYAADSRHYEYAIASALALWRSGKPKDAAAYAKSVAAGIDREKSGIYWSMLRLIQDQNDSSSDLELLIQGEKHLDLKSVMLFYLSEYWICRGKAELAAKYLELAADMKREDTLEYGLIEPEKKRLAALSNG